MYRIIIRPEDPDCIEVLSAFISDMLREGIQIGDEEIIAYASKAEVDNIAIREMLDSLETEFRFKRHIEEIPQINWNKEWESNFDPVVIEDILTIKADFHNIDLRTDHVINIQPKMSFGTGHHATTWMMVKAMSLLNMKDRKVLDAGTGTGILAILASMWKASVVIGFDNDEWSYENAIENLDKNLPRERHSYIDFHNGSLSDIEDIEFDIILANINRNFLLEEAGALASRLKDNGCLVISGFYDVDIKRVLDRFHELNLVAQYLLIRDSWASIILTKKHIN